MEKRALYRYVLAAIGLALLGSQATAAPMNGIIRQGQVAQGVVRQGPVRQGTGGVQTIQSYKIHGVTVVNGKLRLK